MKHKTIEQTAKAQLLSEEAFLRPKECAQMLGISIATFWRLRQRQEIVTLKLGERTTVVSMKNLRAFIARKEAMYS